MSLYLGENLISGSKPINLGVRNIGEIFPSLLPVTDAGAYLLDGGLILGGGIYQGFVDYIAGLYSETLTDWTQPVLTSNGTMGGVNFAVSSNVAQYTGNDVWRAFDGVTSGGNYFHSQSGTTTGYIDIYNPVPIKITNFKIYNQDGSGAQNRASSSGVIYGSDNGSDWTQLATYTNSVQTVGGTWDIDLSSNENYYKYYRMESTAGGSDSYWVISEIQITAKYKKLPSYFCTETEWQTAVTTYGVCGKFVYDSTNNTVRLPKVTGKIEGTTDLTALGDLEPLMVKLPNITGSFDADSRNPATSGSFSYQNVSDWKAAGTGFVIGTKRFTMDASSSSSVYSGNGTDTKIHEQAINVLYYIVIANSTKTDIEVDIDEVTTDLNGKADVDLTNVNSTGQYNLIQYALSNIQDTDSSKVGYLYNVSDSNANIYAPQGGKWLVLRNEQVNQNNAIKYGFFSGTLGNFVGTIVNGETQVASYSSQVIQASCLLYVTLLKIA